MNDYILLTLLAFPLVFLIWAVISRIRLTKSLKNLEAVVGEITGERTSTNETRNQRPLVSTIKIKNIERWVIEGTKKLSDSIDDHIYRNHILRTNNNSPSLIAMRNVHEIKKNFEEIKALKDRFFLAEWFYNKPSPLLESEMSYIKQCVRQNELVLYPEGPNDICSVFVATRLTGTRNENTSSLEEVFKQGHTFIQGLWKKRDDGKRVFRDRYGEDGEESLFSIYNGVSALSDMYLGGWIDKSRWDKELINEAYDAIFKYRARDDNNKVFRYNLNSMPSISATFHALRTIKIIDNILSEKYYGDIFSPVPGGKLTGIEVSPPEGKYIVNFIRSCLIRDEYGYIGFGSNPQSEKSNILNMRYAFQLLRLLVFENSVRSSDLVWLPANELLEYILACFFKPPRGESGGFSLETVTGKDPEHVIAPCLLTSMAAINSVKSIELFRLHDIIVPDVKYNSLISRFLELGPNMNRFIDSIKIIEPRKRDEILNNGQKQTESTQEVETTSYSEKPDFEKMLTETNIADTEKADKLVSV